MTCKLVLPNSVGVVMSASCRRPSVTCKLVLHNSEGLQEAL